MPFTQRLARRQGLLVAFEQAALLDGGQMLAEDTRLGAAANLLETQQQNLVAIVVQYLLCRLVRGLFQLAVALVDRQ